MFRDRFKKSKRQMKKQKNGMQNGVQMNPPLIQRGISCASLCIFRFLRDSLDTARFPGLANPCRFLLLQGACPGGNGGGWRLR